MTLNVSFLEALLARLEGLMTLNMSFLEALPARLEA